MFEEFLPDEVPRPQRLFNDFNLPYGQAQYVSRVLNDRWQPRYRNIARAQLRSALEVVRQAALNSINDGDLSSPQSITTTSAGRLELIRQCEALAATDPKFRWPRSKDSFGDMRQIDMESRTVLAVLNAME